MSWSKVVEAFKKNPPSLRAEYFSEGKCCAIGSLAREIGDDCVNKLLRNQTTRIDYESLDSVRHSIASCFGITEQELSVLQAINDHHGPLAAIKHAKRMSVLETEGV